MVLLDRISSSVWHWVGGIEELHFLVLVLILEPRQYKTHCYIRKDQPRACGTDVGHTVYVQPMLITLLPTVIVLAGIRAENT